MNHTSILNEFENDFWKESLEDFLYAFMEKYLKDSIKLFLKEILEKKTGTTKTGVLNPSKN